MHTAHRQLISRLHAQLHAMPWCTSHPCRHPSLAKNFISAPPRNVNLLPQPSCCRPSRAAPVAPTCHRYRTQITGREALGVILQRRAAETAGRGDAGSLCSEDPVTGAMACEVPAAAEKVTSSTSK